jgi:hypothetical protein
MVASTRSGRPGDEVLAREVGDLGAERLAVPAGRESQPVVARLFPIAGASDVGSQVAAVTRRHHAIASALDHQGGHVDSRQHGADIDIVDHP